MNRLESKVFGIGLPRTATKSLATALSTIGIHTVHFPFRLYRKPDHAILSKYDGFVDSPLPLIYKDLDARFPGSKFILTLRPIEAWIDSMAWMMEEGRILWAWSGEVDCYHRELIGTHRFDAPTLRKAYVDHLDDVRRHFTARPADLLELDAAAGAGYPELCHFLGRPLVSESYPRGNKRRKVSAGRRLLFQMRLIGRGTGIRP